MPRYHVTVQETCDYVVEVEATDPTEAGTRGVRAVEEGTLRGMSIGFNPVTFAVIQRDVVEVVDVEEKS